MTDEKRIQKMFDQPGDQQTARRFSKGAAVTIFRLGPSGFFIEGRAVIEGVCRRAHYFRVRLDGEKVSRVRFVPLVPLDWQKNPERCLALLRAFWEASLAPPAINEFFPAREPEGDER